MPSFYLCGSPPLPIEHSTSQIDQGYISLEGLYTALPPVDPIASFAEVHFVLHEVLSFGATRKPRLNYERCAWALAHSRRGRGS